jgi:transposase
LGFVRVSVMRKGISITVTAEDRVRLDTIIRNRNSLQKHVWRARIIVLTADGEGTTAITRAVGKGKTVVWRWQERFMHEGIQGLTCDKTRPSRIPPLPAETVDRVVALTNQAPPHEATHWTAPAMAKTVAISPSSVRRIWKGHGLQPHRVRWFKLSNDPGFADKLKDVVGLYVDPPAHAVVLSIDEKSQIQALDRTQPGLPMKKGRCTTMTHDYKRHGTTTLFAALDILQGKVIGRCMQRHRHQEFIRFLNAIEGEVPPTKRSTWCSTTMPPISTRGSPPGWRAISASPSTSPRLPAPGPMPSKACLPRSPGNASNAASSPRLSSFRPPSTASSPNPTISLSPLSGPNPPTPSSPPCSAGDKR